VTRDQVDGILDAGDTATGFDLGHSFLEQALSNTGTDDRLPFGVGDRGILGELPL